MGKKGGAKKKEEEVKPAPESSSESSSSDDEPAPPKAAAKKAAAKPKAKGKKVESSSESSSSEDEAPAKPKSKAKAKAKSKAAPSSSSGSGSSSEDSDSDAPKAKAAPAEPAAPPKPSGPFSVEYRPHTDYPPMTAAVEVTYCPIDGLPPDFCIFGPTWEKSKPWCLENFPKYYPELAGANLDDAKKDAAAATEKGKEKMLPGGKKKREASPHITIKKLSRGGRKCVTSVAGMEGFGIKLDPIAKIFKKKFSCGVAVVKGEVGQPDTVDIQGDFEDEVVEEILKEYKDIPRTKFTINRDAGTKKKGKPK